MRYRTESAGLVTVVLCFRCDECLKCYHFGCLNPPVKKTPKVSGWAWSCSDCTPSDEDKGWHL